MIGIPAIIGFFTNNRIVQAVGALALLLLGLKAYGAKKKSEGKAEANAKNQAKLAAENERVRKTENEIRKAQVDAANKRPLCNKRAANRLRDNGL
jgi:hypothetical protein